jgi:hypothetical protein
MNSRPPLRAYARSLKAGRGPASFSSSFWILRCGLAVACLVALVVAAPRGARAASTSDKAAAQVLFEEARALAKNGNWEDACPKFAQSQKLDPAGGTMLNLANCYEKVGKTASAWVLFMEAEADARRSQRPRRAAEAKRRAGLLKPKLSKLKIDVTEPLEGMVVKRGDEEVSEAQWGSTVPVDPGEYEIVVTAPGKKPWSEKTVVEGDAHEAAVTVPALEDAPVEEPKAVAPPPKDDGPKPPPPDEPSDGTAQWVSGWVVGAVGLAGVGVGVALRVVALSKDDESLQYCAPEDPTQCDPEGVDLRDQAIGLQTGSLVAFIAGGALVATGVILLLTTPSDAEGDEQASLELLPSAGPDGAGVLLRGTF